MWDFLIDNLIEVGGSLLMVLTIGLAKKGSNLINAKIKDQKIATLLNTVSDIVFSTVKEVEQTLVTEVKKARSNSSLEGSKLTKAEALHIKQVAVEKAKDTLGKQNLKQMKKLLKLPVEKVEQLLNTKVEAAVQDVKNNLPEKAIDIGIKTATNELKSWLLASNKKG